MTKFIGVVSVIPYPEMMTSDPVSHVLSISDTRDGRASDLAKI